ncbi:MAG: hypothetical protein ACPL4I_02125 [Bacteroidota bacterium]
MQSEISQTKKCVAHRTKEHEPFFFRHGEHLESLLPFFDLTNSKLVDKCKQASHFEDSLCEGASQQFFFCLSFWAALGIKIMSEGSPRRQQ